MKNTKKGNTIGSMRECYHIIYCGSCSEWLNINQNLKSNSNINKETVMKIAGVIWQFMTKIVIVTSYK